MCTTIAELTDRVNQIRPAMLELIQRIRLLEGELALVADHITLLENTVDRFEGILAQWVPRTAESFRV